ncbi:MAG: hypothetical protein HWD61_13765 [Parachlamydiaceae bacterium]|nr:MAG: hypothetical protein HWD61_13765 [Parachlamydiaceae bacterium]
MAIQSTNLDMLKLLIKNNFHVDDHIAGVTPLYKVLEGSYPGLKGKPIRYEIALFLIENGAKLKVSSISPPSPLALAMKLWNENPEEAKK